MLDPEIPRIVLPEYPDGSGDERAYYGNRGGEGLRDDVGAALELRRENKQPAAPETPESLPAGALAQPFVAGIPLLLELRLVCHLLAQGRADLKHPYA